MGSALCLLCTFTFLAAAPSHFYLAKSRPPAKVLLTWCYSSESNFEESDNAHRAGSIISGRRSVGPVRRISDTVKVY